MIRIKSAAVRKNGHSVIKPITFELRSGEHCVIRGNNGTGKTILLELIAGHITPSEGSVEYDFIHHDDWSARYLERKEKIHYIPSHAMSVFLAGHSDLFYQQRYYEIDNTFIPFVRDLLGPLVDRLPTLNLPSSLNIDRLLNLHVTGLSNGQLKKLLLLKGFLTNVPQVLLLDYPFEGLDQVSRRDLIRFLDHFVENHNVQLIIVDHFDELPSCINRMVTIDEHQSVSIKPYRKAEHGLVGPPPSESLTVNDVIVDLKNVTIRYGANVILDNLNWQIRKGERWALTGRNGCGKTTLFSLIYADHPFAYTQDIHLFGIKRGSGESIWDIKKRINYFGPENLHYLNPKSITQSVHDFLINNHSDMDRLTNLIRFFQLDDIIDKSVRELSSGDLHCILLIKLLLHERELFLLDEPFQFLDPSRIDKFTTSQL
jgi:molybdate transport system ATP-binding protein